jgi:EAL domain-containing protein (putative c-di-GMP-specific phosphodiesterase class I)
MPSWAAPQEAAPATLARVLAACAAGPEGPLQVQRIDATSAAAERDRYALEQDLRGALQNGEFELRYQPQVDAASGRVSGAEALLRWNSPRAGWSRRHLFIPVLESAGMIEEVGLWVLNASCREARTWHRLGQGPLTVAVNVSAHQLDRPDIHTLIKRTLERHSLRAGMLEIELTESAAAADVGRAARLFEALHGLGIHIAIDDFGTGFSSLSALRVLAFDKIKIDRQFVTDVEQRRDSQAICQSIIALGRGLGIRVLAEGVERQEEYLWLRRHGCSGVPGLLFLAAAHRCRVPDVRPQHRPAARSARARRAAGPDHALPKARPMNHRSILRLLALAGLAALAACSKGPPPQPRQRARTAGGKRDRRRAGAADAGRSQGRRKAPQAAAQARADEPEAACCAIRSPAIRRSCSGRSAIPIPCVPATRSSSSPIACSATVSRPISSRATMISPIRRRWPRGRSSASRARRRGPSRSRCPSARVRRPGRIASQARGAGARAGQTRANPAAAQRARSAGLAALNRGAVKQAVGLLQRAHALDPGNAVILRDLQRAERIAATVRARQ